MINPLEVATAGYITVRNTLLISVDGYLISGGGPTDRGDGPDGRKKRQYISDEEAILEFIKAFVICHN